MIVYLAYTKSNQFPQPELIRIYKEESYPLAAAWLVGIGERHGQLPYGDIGKIVLQTHNPSHNQWWWLERHECV